jgi:uncharacterized membrane protein
VSSLLTGAAFGYPFLISAGTLLGRPRLPLVVVGALLLVSMALAWRAGFHGGAVWRVGEAALMMAFLVVAAVVNEEHVTRLGPALPNVVMLLSFGRTLRSGPSLIESLARLRWGELPPHVVTYCWRLTLLWCVFFAANAAFISWLAFYGTLASWTIYTGLLAYLLAGGLFLAELLYRHRRFAAIR